MTKNCSPELLPHDASHFYSAVFDFTKSVTKRLEHMWQSQLRARLVDQLRDHDGALLEYKGNRKPSLTERILTSLFLDYLKAHGFPFTQSVFLPESQAGSWPAFSFQELAQLLHLDKTTSSHLYLKIVRFSWKPVLLSPLSNFKAFPLKLSLEFHEITSSFCLEENSIEQWILRKQRRGGGGFSSTDKLKHFTKVSNFESFFRLMIFLESL